MRLHGPSSFNLNVVPLDTLKVNTIISLTSLVLALEQYLILTIQPKLNDVLVVGGISKSLTKASALAQESVIKPVYVYNVNMTQLVYISQDCENFEKEIKVNKRYC